MSALIFLVDTVFFMLVGACLLRAWFNSERISLAQQPGPFLMALTDWLVMPLRRGMPVVWMRSRLDSGSLIAAALFALAQTALVLFLAAMVRDGDLPSVWLLVPVLAFKVLLKTSLQLVLFMLLGYAVLSWVQPGSPAYQWLGRLMRPLLRPVQKLLPLVGGVDLSPLVLIVLLQVALGWLG